MDASTRLPDISIVIPVFNEQGNVEPLVAEIRKVLEGRLRYELLLVDDGSSDGTLEEIEQAMQLYQHVRLVRHESNLGQSAGVRSGVEAALARVVAVLDGDGQNDPRDIPKLYGRLVLVPALQLVIGERRKRNDSWVRCFSSRVANRVRSRLLGDGVSDTGCGLKVFYRDDYLRLPAFDHMHRFLPALFQRGGGRVAVVPVNHRPRRHGQSKYGIRNRLWVGVMDMMGVMWLQKRRL